MYQQDAYLTFPSLQKPNKKHLIDDDDLLDDNQTSQDENFYSVFEEVIKDEVNSDLVKPLKYLNVSNFAREMSSMENAITIILMDASREI